MVSASTIQKANAIVERGEVQRIDDETFLVKGSTGQVYEVTTIENGWYCKNTNKNDACMGWKFNKRSCSHTQAVLIYLKKS